MGEFLFYVLMGLRNFSDVRERDMVFLDYEGAVCVVISFEYTFRFSFEG